MSMLGGFLNKWSFKRVLDSAIVLYTLDLGYIVPFYVIPLVKMR